MGLEASTEELAPQLDRLHAQEQEAQRTTPLEVTSGGGRVIGRVDLPAADAPMVARYDRLGVDRLIARPWRRSVDVFTGLEVFARECIAR
jgi:hypothetical protein